MSHRTFKVAFPILLVFAASAFAAMSYSSWVSGEWMMAGAVAGAGAGLLVIFVLWGLDILREEGS